MPENPIFAINARVARLREQGADIVLLTAGEPSTHTADAIVRAAQDAVADPTTHHYGAAAGEPTLRRAIAASLPGDGWTESDVVVTVGAKHALHLAVRAVTSGGDEVLVIEPGWPGHAAAVRAAGAEPVAVRTRDNLSLDPADVAAAITSRTRAVILASPANPTGTVLPQQAIGDLAAIASRANLWVISDDVYSALAYSGGYAHVLDAVPQLRDRTIMVDSVSKEHAMTGWRIGWLAGPAAVVDSAREHLAATITHVPLAMQRAATAALHDHDGPSEARQLYRSRRDRLVAALDRLPGIDCPVPDGGMFAFPSVAGLLAANGWSGSTALLEHLIDAGVAVVPGEAFAAPDRLRICFAVDDATLDTAIERLTASLTELQRVSA
ncbi:pyridoxal phosphate-dependent aminotransferase [Agromyces bracchium]|uniref:Aminotransferase n=1 Tax=Agromyces bracchium TaxID=88376 RepID=A0A6I3M9Z2_9MICO|nr:aminotransferase class I/II-fold pyridoxal phosphate-dependent enzyme [Agromyces bracchium]MTH70025.1 aminotransferase class I/II-fold pyridoxal phosphate-dependent enzyme [Agromyces bracchium]